MAHHRVTLLRRTFFEEESYANVLGAGAAQAEIFSEVAAERAGDKEKSLAVFDRWLELAMGAREQRRAPWRELIRLESAREQDRMPAGAAELALELTWPERRHRAPRAQAEEVQALHLFFIQWQLASGKRGEERARILDPHEAARPRASRGQAG